MYEFKRGDKFDMLGDATLLIDGEPGVFDGVTLTAALSADDGQGSPKGEAFATPAAEWLDQPAGIYHVIEDDTTDWPTGKVLIEVTFTWADGRPLTTPSMPFKIVKRLHTPA